MAKGPFVLVAVAVFAAGFAWRIIGFLSLTAAVPRRERKSFPAPIAAQRAEADERFLLSGRAALARALSAWGRGLRRSVLAGNPVMAPLSLLFHILLFMLPLLLPSHNILVFQGLRVALPVIPEALADRLTLVVLAIGSFSSSGAPSCRASGS